MRVINNIFEAVFIVGFIVGLVIRKIYTARCPKSKAIRKYKSVIEIILLSAAGIAMILPFISIFTSWLDFADYHLPVWLGWIGTPVFAMALLLLWRSHADLDHNWSATIQIKQGHTLVTGGVYRHIRHPMYAAHLLWAIAQGLLLQNWLAGWAFLVVSMPLYIIRIPKEEQLMIEQFNERYRRYISRTGRLIPRFWK
jgi:protein-S-isoprenylcysteine O-methyltransferase Ste14